MLLHAKDPVHTAQSGISSFYKPEQLSAALRIAEIWRDIGPLGGRTLLAAFPDFWVTCRGRGSWLCDSNPRQKVSNLAPFPSLA